MYKFQNPAGVKTRGILYIKIAIKLTSRYTPPKVRNSRGVSTSLRMRQITGKE